MTKQYLLKHEAIWDGPCLKLMHDLMIAHKIMLSKLSLQNNTGSVSVYQQRAKNNVGIEKQSGRPW